MYSLEKVKTIVANDINLEKWSELIDYYAEE